MHFMTIQTESSRWWPTSFTERDANRFLELVQERLDAHHLAFSGTAPHLVAEDGRQIFLGNLAEQCAQRGKSRWPAIVDEFFACLAGINNLSDPLAISPEVVRKSLRLRLFPVSVPGAKVAAAATPTRDLLELVVRRPAMPGTEWLLYLRRPGAGQGVIDVHLEGWGIAVDEAFSLARANTLAEEPASLYERNRILLASGESMFSHAAVLTIGARFPPNRAYFVGVPNRNELVATVIKPNRAGIDRMAQALKVSFERYNENPYRIHLGGWFVAPGGIGEFGENAESIGLYDAGPFGDELSVKLGPKTHEYFGELR